MESAILEFMQKLGILPDNFAEQSLMGGPQGALPPPGVGGKDKKKGQQPPPGMLPPMGLLPGADPLAYQQMQAQLQMMNKKK